jgi:iron complex transport system permease protein
VLAGANLLIFLGDPRSTHTVVFWMLGGLGHVQWAHLIWLLAVLIPTGRGPWLRTPEMNAGYLGWRNRCHPWHRPCKVPVASL